MTQDDVLFGYRLQVFDLAGRTTVAHGLPDVRVSTARPTTAGSAQVDRQGLGDAAPA